MDTRQLKTLLAVSQFGSFAQAAIHVNLTPSAVSQQMAALEVELGVALFDRSTRPPTLNTKGYEVVNSAHTIMQIVTETKTAVHNSQKRKTLAFGSLRTGSVAIVPHAFAMLREKYPNLELRLHVGLPNDMIEAVNSGELDAALVSENMDIPASLAWHEVFSEELIILAPHGAQTLSLEGLIKTIPYIKYRSQVPLANQIEAEISQFNRKPKQIVEANTMSAVVGCVQAGLGFAIVPKGVVMDAENTLCVQKHLASDKNYRRLGVVQRKRSSDVKIVQDFIHILATQEIAFQGLGHRFDD